MISFRSIVTIITAEHSRVLDTPRLMWEISEKGEIMRTTETLSRFIVDTRYDNIPEEAFRLSKRLVLDCLGAALAGYGSEPEVTSAASAPRRSAIAFPDLSSSSFMSTK